MLFCYIYDGGVNVQEYAVDAQGQSSLTKQLIRGTGMGGGIGSVLYSETVSSGSVTVTEYFAYNAVGSVVALLNGSGTVTSTSDFEAFGSEVRNSGSTTENRKFCIKERDSSIGLDNFGFRYYDADLGRFIQRDPSGYPDGPNNYLYCHNNPINFVDPLGLETIDDYNEEIENQRAAKKEAWSKYQKKSREDNNYSEMSDGERSKYLRKERAALTDIGKGYDDKIQSLGLKISHIKGTAHWFNDAIETRHKELREKYGDNIPSKELDHLVIVDASKLDDSTAVFKKISRFAGAHFAGKNTDMISGLQRDIILAEAGGALTKGVFQSFKAWRAARAARQGSTVGDLRAAGLKDAHLVIQDAAVRDLPGYQTNSAPGVQLNGPAFEAGTLHNIATQVQRMPGGGTYGAERRIAYKALRRSGLNPDQAKQAIKNSDRYFKSIGVSSKTKTRIPGNRRKR